MARAHRAAPRYHPLMEQPPAVERISVVEAARRLDAAGSEGDPMLVDVREPAEYAQFRATGAVLMPLSVFQLRFSQLPRDRPLLLICAAGQRSLAAGEFLDLPGVRDGRQRRGRHDRLDARGPARPDRAAGRGRGRPSRLTTARCGAGAGATPRPLTRACGLDLRRASRPCASRRGRARPPAVAAWCGPA